MTDHSITPPPELVEQWVGEIWHEGTPVQVAASDLHIAHRAAQWGADQELEACCRELEYNFMPDSGSLRAARRPKPPSLKEKALEAMREMQIEPCFINGVDTNAAIRAKYETIRRALEGLPDA